MTEQQTESHEAPSSQGISDKALKRLVKWGALALVVLVAAFSVVYYLGQHVNSGPSLTDRTIKSAEDAVRAQPNNIGLRIALAGAYSAAHRADDALNQYNVVIKAVPDSTAALLARAEIYMGQDKLDPALKDLNQVLAVAAKSEFGKVDPSAESAHYDLASIYAKRSQWTQAQTEVKAALAMNNNDADAWYLAGQVAQQLKLWKPAVEAYSQALAFIPTGWCDPYTGLIASLQAQGANDQAALNAALQQACKGQTAQAVKALQPLTTSKTVPVSVSAMLELAVLAYQSGDSAQAKTWYQKVLTVQPTNATAKASLAQLNAATGSTGGN